MIEQFKQLPPWVRLAFTFPLLFLNGFLLAVLLNFLQPFVSFLVIASILAFVLELMVGFLQKQGMGRGLSILTVVLITLAALILLGFILFPLMAWQLSQLLENIPAWIESTNQSLRHFSQTPFAQRLSLNVESLVGEAIKRLSVALEAVGSQALNVLFVTLTGAINSIIVLILTIFLLIGGESFRDGLLGWLPTPWRDRLPAYLGKSFRGYFISRALLSGVSSLVRTLLFAVLGVPYPLLFAFGIGLASLIPFLAGLVILITTILLGFYDVALSVKFAIASFVIDQLTENLFAPRLIGDLIGLNPVWIIISLFIGAKLGGILGLFLAVPLASAIKQIIDDLRSPVLPEIEAADS